MESQAVEEPAAQSGGADDQISVLRREKHRRRERGGFPEGGRFAPKRKAPADPASPRDAQPLLPGPPGQPRGEGETLSIGGHFLRPRAPKGALPADRRHRLEQIALALRVFSGDERDARAEENGVRSEVTKAAGGKFGQAQV